MVPRVLIVDDEPDLVLILQTMLEGQGYRTLSAADGLEAIDVAQRELPQLVILDVMMPEMNGFQVCRLLKGEHATRDIPILMLTAKGQSKDVFWGRDAGADVYMTKPYDNEELLAKVAELAGRPE